MQRNRGCLYIVLKEPHLTSVAGYVTNAIPRPYAFFKDKFITATKLFSPRAVCCSLPIFKKI